MRSPAHLPTLRGLGPDEEQLDDDDIVEVDGALPAKERRYAMVTVPPSRPATVSGVYSMFPARSRRTLRGNGDV